jgi:hypothetical protein
MTTRVPLPNGTTTWVSSNVDPSTLAAPALADPSWIELKRVTALTHSGGDEKFTAYSPLAEYEDVRKPSGRNPMDFQLTFQDDPDSAYVAAIRQGRDARTALAWKFKLPSGLASIVFTGYASGSIIPILDRNQLMVIEIVIAVIGMPKRITS